MLNKIFVLGVMLKEHVSWIDHVRTIENKIAENVGLLYRAYQFLKKKIFLKLYIFCIFIPIWIMLILHRWVHNATKMERVYLKQKHAAHIVFKKDQLTHWKPLFENLNTLNVYQINIYEHLNFMHKFINNQIPSIFKDLLKRPDHKYPTNFYWIVQNILFPSVDLNYGMMLLIKKRKIFNLILSFKRKLNRK